MSSTSNRCCVCRRKTRDLSKVRVHGRGRDGEVGLACEACMRAYGRDGHGPSAGLRYRVRAPSGLALVNYRPELIDRDGDPLDDARAEHDAFHPELSLPPWASFGG